ncbi:hypothetical protein [Streptomyces sp. NPDC002619]|uniref:hypothetical protein n=1 Tax=Streptomyces sp. NPDC002619 TaxID=3364655 RepID=UPI0036C1E482
MRRATTALLALLTPLGPGARALLLRLLNRFGWKPVLAGAALLVYACARYRTWLVWILIAVAVLSWMHAPEPADHEPKTAAGGPQVDLARWLLDTIGDRPGIHLRDLYPAMRELPGQEGRSDGELRAALRTLGVPVHRSLRIGRIAGRSGVRRGDVEALLPSLGDSPVERHGDAGQGADSPALSEAGEGV